ncbi:molybdopterin-guanine dinucleotide biosynthesis protein B [Oceanobacillus sp. FSL H7-0719]|uniref:molybdopterin-guanine dinucleotide biosynthesis protein B n=1 Tax=Oceanobacillus sp. FSL H7-0719 TaxID=2954507 RepID=UPI003253522D
MKVIQIIGFKNSGKTTLATKIIEKLAKQGYRAASLKHHGHGGVPIGMKNTDSEKHRQAGAIFSGVEGDGLFQLSAASWNMEQMLSVYQLLQIDVLVMEGFKKEPFPKIALIKRKEEMVLLEQAENIMAVVSPLSLSDSAACPVFDVNNINELFEWLHSELLHD